MSDGDDAVRELRSQLGVLSMWLFLAFGASAVCVLVVIQAHRADADFATLAVGMHLLVALPTLFAFHRATLWRHTVAQQASHATQPVEPICGGVFSECDVPQAFAAFFLYFVLITYNFLSVATSQCRGAAFLRGGSNGSGLFSTPNDYVRTVVAFIFILYAIFIVEHRKRQSNNAFYVSSLI